MAQAERRPKSYKEDYEHVNQKPLGSGLELAIQNGTLFLGMSSLFEAAKKSSDNDNISVPAPQLSSSLSADNVLSDLNGSILFVLFPGAHEQAGKQPKQVGEMFENK
jgi:hypothetical protein